MALPNEAQQFTEVVLKLVTVVVRSMGRPHLRDALQSVCAQDHTLLEVLVVDATGGDHPPLPELPWRHGHTVRLIGTGKRLPRPQAANAGLLAASGEWICFLDDDDFYDDNFISSMLRHARQQPGRLVIYGSSRTLAPDGSVTRVFGVPFNRALMFCGPLLYWPAALINRRVIALGCRFDERLSVCEDRDFLAQIAEHGDFGFVPVTGFNYRLTLGTSGTATGDNRHPERHIPYEALLRAKWAGSGLYHTQRAAAGSRSAVAAYFRGDLTGARAAFAAVLRDYPDDPNALHGLGRLDFEAGQVDLALQQVERAIDITPDAAEYYLTLAEIVAARGDTSRARNAAACAAQDSRLREPALALLSRLPAGTVTGEAPPAPPSGRLAPCSCGSGRRYKDCHGKLAAGAVAAVTQTASRAQAARSTPPRPVGQVQQARAALAAGEATRALALLDTLDAEAVVDAGEATAYGAIALNAGDCPGASKWFIRALQINPDSEAGALLHQCSERQYAPIFAASVYREVARLRERLQPDVVAISAQSCDTVHIVADLANVGGSERHAVNLMGTLAPHLPVRLWSTVAVHPAWLEAGATVIDGDAGCLPREGTMVLIGQFVTLGEWFRHTRFHRLVIRNNIDQPQLLLERLTEVELCNKRLTVQFNYPSAQFRSRVGLPGSIEYPLTDLDRFHPALRTRRPTQSGFIVGRHSRDHYTKHHPNDPAFFRNVIRAGHCVRLMGASVIASALQNDSADIRGRIEVIAAGAESAADFLTSLDCFIYRAHPYWYETGGNVIAEAMAMAIPVIVIGEVMGFAELIEHDVNGYCVATEAEALAKIDRLASDEMLRARIGRSARARMERLATEQHEAIVAFYAGTARASVTDSMPLTAC